MSEKPVYIGICISCGKPITRDNLSTTIEGRVIDWIEKISISGVSYLFCEHCANNVKEYLKGGIKEAIKRQENDASIIARLEALDEKDKGIVDSVIVGS